MDRRSTRKGNKTVKVKHTKGGRSKQNDIGAKGPICTGTSKPVSEIRDVLQDLNKPDVGKMKISGAQTDIKLQGLKKRKKPIEEKSHVRKKVKKEKSGVPSCSTSGRGDVKLSEKQLKNNTQVVVVEDVKLGTFREGSQRGKTTTKKDKGADTRRKSSISSPAKPDTKKLRQEANLDNEAKDQEISSEKKKSRLTKVNQAKEKLADADLSIKSRVLENLDGAEDFKKKGKSPMNRALEGKSSHSLQENIMASENSTDEGDDSEMEWEDVSEAEIVALENNGDETSSLGDSNLPSTSRNVEVTIQVPGKKKRGGKCSKEEIRKWVQRRINRVKKELQIRVHKVHLLVLLANGLRRNELCNNSLLQGIGLSLVLSQFTQRTVAKAWDMSFLTRITTWFKNKAPDPGEVHTGHSEGTYLMRVLEKKVYFLVVILRALGLSVRLVMSLQALNIKVDDDNGGKKSGPSRTPKDSKANQNKVKDKKQKQALKKEQKNSPKENLLNKMKGKATPKKVVSSSSTTNKTLRKRSKVDYAVSSDTNESEYFEKDKKKASGDSSSASFCNFSDDEDDFDIPSKTPRRKSTSSKELRKRNLDVAENLQDTGESSRVAKRGTDIWVEVYLEKEKRWICIDGEMNSVNQPEECEKHATKPIKYVVAFDNESSIKDVTARYASGWLTSTPKLRVDPEWWTDTLDIYKTKELKRDKKEDSVLKARLLHKPLPTSVTEYKNHPLYVLKRHLLKFEAIYPEAAATLGFCRGEPVYSRDCVHMLHTRERWMKEARVVKSGETTYKIVKGRKTKRKMLENVGEITAELFGRWQTEDYVPPPVIDGKIPRNEYGNVELFKPSMLPLGACHIQVPGIHRLARKLNIEAVPAVVGFDFHGGFNHPVIDGVVVCEENKDVLLDAWNTEQEEKIKREQEKREKRVVDNWAHLVRSLRIRERLKRKYNMEDEPDVEQKTKEKEKSNQTEDVTDISLSWPLNRQEGKSTRGDNGHCHVFLEVNHRQDPVTGEWNKICSCGHKEPL